VAQASDRLAKALKLKNRAALNPEYGSIKRSGPFPKETQKLNGAREAAIAHFRDRLHSVACTLGHDTVKIAEELGLPYAWVSQGLLHAFVAGNYAMAAGQEIVLPLPQITVTFDPSTETPRGRMPKEGVIERYSQWYVRRNVSGVELDELALEYHATHEHPASSSSHTWRHDRKLIYHGIKEVERLLKLTVR
jgi:hypothetical protein